MLEKEINLKAKGQTDRNIKYIKQYFPNIITEVKDKDGKTVEKINFEKLQQELSDEIVEGNREVYDFTWPGKKQAVIDANKPTNKTLRPCREESVNFDTTENLYIEGDNLEVLKLLQQSYFKKVKMIYIDPPYNTGNDFIYSDSFKMDKEDYEDAIDYRDEDGNIQFRQNRTSNGRFHSDWCSMIYSRLKLAYNLLADDGIIFISIDDNEQANLKKICDEVFGSDNFVNCIINQSAKSVFGSKASAKDKTIIKTKDYILCYLKKSSSDFIFNPLYTKSDNSIFTNHDFVYENGIKISTVDWFKLNYNKLFEKYNLTINKENIIKLLKLDNNFYKEVFNKLIDIQYRTGGVYNPEIPNDILEKLKNNEIVEYNNLLLIKENNGKGETSFLRSLRESCHLSNDHFQEFCKVDILGDIWDNSQGYGNINAEGSITFGGGKKPVELIKKMLILSNTKTNDIILDFFSGSATTAHAVMQLNAEEIGGGDNCFLNKAV